MTVLHAQYAMTYVRTYQGIISIDYHGQVGSEMAGCKGFLVEGALVSFEDHSVCSRHRGRVVRIATVWVVPAFRQGNGLLCERDGV